ncbi:MAG: HNH endonuclease [Proteobacteria bacterium]|jgi:5-methylcytosine-specific restriction endonuclease McrA|nr:HNH endonuclease [Pseudomonadota bacterium]
MLFNEKALIIDPTAFTTYNWDDWSKLRVMDDEEGLRSAFQQFKIPEIILLTDYDKLPSRKVKFSRRMIHKRDNYTCGYCGKQPDLSELTIDHIVPRAQGGQTTWTNCTSCCINCNQKKDNRTPVQAHMKLRREVKKPEFSLFKVEKRFVYKSWKHFIDKMVSEAFWTTELENDNPKE